MSPEYLKAKDGIEMICGMESVYMMEVEEPLSEQPPNQEGMDSNWVYKKTIVGSTANVILAKRYNIKETNKVLGEDEDEDGPNLVYELTERNKYANIPFLRD